MNALLLEIETGRRTIAGTDFPIVDQLRRTGEREWTVVRDLCNGVPRTAWPYRTEAAAREALGSRLVGRKPRTGVAGRPITLRASDEERARWKEGADREGLSLGEWLRSAADLHARVIPLVVAAVLAATAGCTEQADQDLNPDAVPTAAPCQVYEKLSDASWRRESPYIAPVKTGTRITVSELDFWPLWGKGDVYRDADQQPIGTQVWAPSELHEADGSVRLGAVGRVGTEIARCEWLDAVLVLQ